HSDIELARAGDRQSNRFVSAVEEVLIPSANASTPETAASEPTVPWVVAENEVPATTEPSETVTDVDAETAASVSPSQEEPRIIGTTSVSPTLGKTTVVVAASPKTEQLATVGAPKRVAAGQPARLAPTAPSSSLRVVTPPSQSASPKSRELAAVGVADHQNAPAEVEIVNSPSTPAGAPDLLAETSGDVSASTDDQLWVLALGQHDDEISLLGAWNALILEHLDILQGISRFGNYGPDAQTLLAGPIDQESRAVAICAVLNARSAPCKPQKL
ncbi:MAG: hypothetical protein AAFY56_16345, partial [Pseudomonadota bacterium]